MDKEMIERGAPKMNPVENQILDMNAEIARLRAELREAVEIVDALSTAQTLTNIYRDDLARARAFIERNREEK